MRIADFALERYFARWEFAVRHVLCASDVEPYGLDELLALADDDSRERWTSLTLGYTESLGLPALRSAIASRSGASLLDAFVQLAQETSGNIGFLEGLWRFRHLIPEARVEPVPAELREGANLAP